MSFSAAMRRFPFIRQVLVALDVAFLVAMLLLPAAWLLDPLNVFIGAWHLVVDWSLKVALAPFVLLAVRIAISRMAGADQPLPPALLGRKGVQRFALALFSLYAFFGAFEEILTLAGYTSNLPPIVFKGKNEDLGVNVPECEPDPELLWKFKPGTMFHGRRINGLGFREREVDAKKKPGTRRVICLGDSVTGQGRPGYSQYLNDLLVAKPPTPEPWEAFNMGVHGYCVLQGLRLFERMGPPLEPDVVSIYFGWNDHWLDDVPIGRKMAVRMNSVQGQLFEILKKKRFFMFLVTALNPARQYARVQNDLDVRVQPDEYRWALGALIAEIRAANAVPIVITAPRGPLTSQLELKRYVHSIAAGEKIHDQYVAITRDVARQKQAVLLDLAETFKNPKFQKYLAPDGIHFDSYGAEGDMTNDPPSQPGLEMVAAELYKAVVEATQSPDWKPTKTPGTSK